LQTGMVALLLLTIAPQALHEFAPGTSAQQKFE
jgi:hypothetical protein